VILVDTSAWIEFFRGTAPVAQQVDMALAEGEAAWCGPIATELRRGFASAKERANVLRLLEGCHWLAQPDALWEEAGDLGFVLRRKGLTVKTFDLLIATYALSHGTALLAVDGDFKAIGKKGIPLDLVTVGEAQEHG
jgi:predicted nucleic acid-binding protein